VKQIATQKSNVDRDVARGVQVLLSFALLKSYDDDVKAYEILEVSCRRDAVTASRADGHPSGGYQDVQRCAERIFGIDSPASSADQEDLPPVDLLVDVLIGYLDRASSDLRALATAVFGLISAKATGSTIEHLIAVSNGLASVCPYDLDS
jgi:DNA polymerase phi